MADLAVTATATYPLARLTEQAVDAVVLDNSDGSTVEVTASLTQGPITRWERLECVQPSVILDEFFESEDTIRNYPGFQSAMAKRGITDMSLITIDPW